MKTYRDTETGSLITETALKEEFEKLKQEYPDEYDYSFSEYIKNCTSKNGFLEELK